jgi:hypothetical protein
LLELLSQRGVGGDAVLLDHAELLVDGLKRVGQRAHEVRNGCMSPVEIALHLLVGFLEGGLRQRREGLAVGLQRLRGHRAERVAQSLLGVGEDGVPLI